ncbi:hypothetical protein Ocin01_15543 [Orchesella cincta]|uniref:Uncharacterized protein n=1 Tax=Orchesella cincta TaxID=48709 RepID=A0A1D2MDW7_ORCCI|nr:hypothetical protein Ocin01_15543 [Orchesella cincta]
MKGLKRSTLPFLYTTSETVTPCSTLWTIIPRNPKFAPHKCRVWSPQTLEQGTAEKNPELNVQGDIAVS